MQRRVVAPFLVAVAAGLAITTAGPALLPGPAPPACPDCNVLFVEIDPLRADHMGVYGYDRNTTPAIDRIAAESYVFNRTFSQSGHTVPSTFSTFTGRYPSQHGVVPGDRLDAAGANRTLVLPEVLQDAGYRTYAAVSRPWFRQDPTFDQGFDAYITAGADGTSTINKGEAATKMDALRPLLDRTGDDPFFLFYQTFATHHPYFPPEEFSGRFDGTLPGFREEARSRYEATWERLLGWDNITPAERGALVGRQYDAGYYFASAERNASVRRHIISEYDASIRHADAIVARLRAMLRATGHNDDTIIVIGSAHGEAFNEHGDWAHGEMHTQVMRVPLIVHVPGMAEQRRMDAYTANIDIGPTLLDMLGVDAPAFRERAVGRSLTGVMRGGSLPDRHIMGEHEQDQVAFIDTATRLKYLVGREEPPAVYNLSSDWMEREPLDNATLRDRMRRTLERFRADLPGIRGTPDSWPYYGDVPSR